MQVIYTVAQGIYYLSANKINQNYIIQGEPS